MNKEIDETHLNFKGFFSYISSVISWTIFVLLMIIGVLLIYYYISLQLYRTKGEKFEPFFSIYTIVSPSMEPNINTLDAIVNVKINDKTKTVRQIFKKDLKLYAETGSIVYVHPNQKEIWVEIDDVSSKHNISLKNSYFTRFDKNGNTLYSVILPHTHCYAVLPFKFYQENIFYPL